MLASFPDKSAGSGGKAWGSMVWVSCKRLPDYQQPSRSDPLGCFVLGCLRCALGVVRTNGCARQAVQPCQAVRHVNQNAGAQLYGAQVTAAQRFVGRAPAHAGQAAPAFNGGTRRVGNSWAG